MLYSFVQVQVIRKKLFLYFNIWIGDKFSCCFLVFFRFTSLRFYLIALLKPSLMFINRIACNMGGSPGLVDDDSWSRGCGFESQRCILDGHISHLFLVKFVLFVWGDWNKPKRGQSWPIFKNDTKYFEAWPRGRFLFKVVTQTTSKFI